MIDPKECCAAVLRAELSLGDLEGEQLYEGTIDPDELAEKIVAALGADHAQLEPTDDEFIVRCGCGWWRVTENEEVAEAELRNHRDVDSCTLRGRVMPI